MGDATEKLLAYQRNPSRFDISWKDLRADQIAALNERFIERKDAIKLLADADDAVSLEARGDAHFALKQTEQARTDYAQALRQLDSAAQQRGLLELKLSEVGGTPDEPEVES